MSGVVHVWCCSCLLLLMSVVLLCCPAEPELHTGLVQQSAWRSYAAASPNAVTAAKASSCNEGAANSAETFQDLAPWQREQQQQQQQQQQQVELALPTRRHLLVLVADGEEQQQLALSRAAAAGFDR
jgi:hypothetical protein